jgi:hypothetical protein
MLQMMSDGKMTKIIPVNLKKLHNFVVNNFSIEIISSKNYVLISHVRNFANDIGWKNDQNQSSRSQKVINLYS